MKTPTSFKGKDVTNGYILLVVLLLLSGATLYSEEVVQHEDKRGWNEDLDPGFRTTSIKTKCYSIPYSREQLKKIEKDGGEEREELNRLLLEMTQDEDLTQIVAPPKVIFDENHSMVCLDLRDPSVVSDPFEARIV